MKIIIPFKYFFHFDDYPQLAYTVYQLVSK